MASAYNRASARVEYYCPYKDILRPRANIRDGSRNINRDSGFIHAIEDRLEISAMITVLSAPLKMMGATAELE